MLGPKDLNSVKYDMDKIISEIDASLKVFHKWYPWDSAILDYELPVEVRNELAIKYLNGWKYIYHITTSENGERAGLTAFHFSEESIEKDINKFLVTKSEINENEFVVYRNDVLLETISK